MILIHQLTGIKQTIKSPHFPCGLYVVAILGLNLRTLYLNIRINNKKYKTQKYENQNHHQYCHCVRWINISDLVLLKPTWKFDKKLISVIIPPHIILFKFYEEVGLIYIN